MAIYLDRDGVESCTSKVDKAIEDLYTAAKNIDTTIMNELPKFWQGAASDSTQAMYVEEYQTLLTTKMPQTVQDLKRFINECKKAIIDVDNQLSGK